MSTSDRGHSSKSWGVAWGVAAVAGIALWAVLLRGEDPARAWRSLLVNFLFFSSLSAGLVVWPALVRTCNGKWQQGVERYASAAIAFALPSLLALALLWGGSGAWAPWYRVNFHQGMWLNNSFLFGRDLAALLLFWGWAAFHLARRRRGSGRRSGSILLVVYSLVFSLLGFDLVMALDPHFRSNLAGGYFFMSGLYIGISAWALIACLKGGAKPKQLHDLGNLVLAFSLMTTYLMYAHLLPFWYENLPPEIRFLVPRMHNENWSPVSVALLCTVYFGPLVLLLPARFKENRWTLGAVALLVVAGMWLERWWLVAPTFDPLARLGLSELSLALGCTGLLGLGMLISPRHLPPDAADGDKP
ncbi:menaquinol oxidoreductase complex ACIII, menaquinol-binding membrane protein subunit ActF [Citrifermentans bemidjiense Bem]|uniref:Menaquinol oxidoreductase complex ACIII, menaquinol-binding membrane protein subunit ActF n=1 Tax=Citrifermentans bemidjiense (strain ATCC BAA-1014 / DSM 16622 / JCM 12645 / Bem) TaxID=404380 RepID=B5E917_CITBB|nr:hypothetical protein [Citrifermentans bemidjiense]ACH37154.1 menaquinol oxidoreductase complex ACIII, menaquinol-binding membrane protein subunit ActF [Citrifermentans bemidjiense Bem]